MEDAKQKLLDMNINGAIVSVIVERERDGDVEVLLQTRWKPERDPVYSGTLEIPAGGIMAYENIYAAAKREVWEEIGLRVTRFDPDIRTPPYAPRDDDCFAFLPFCCQQQLKGGIPRIGVVFICRVEEAEVKPKAGEAREAFWVKLEALRDIVGKQPQTIFTLQLPVLNYYLQRKGETK
ncbi:MAG TPA: NUDIX hydrolase [Anaerolineales bacterium]|nr:NUDIX hydrolase [Anaerolineales bacterium]